MNETLRTLIVSCLIYSALADYTETDNGLSLGSRLSADVKEYISMLMSDITEKHNRDIQDLKSIINSQGNKMIHLESENHEYASVIRELQKRIENIEMETRESKDTRNHDTITDVPTGNKTQPDSDTDTDKTRSNNGAGQNPPSPLNSRIDRKRAVNVENEVAFFAAMTSLATHLGTNQDIVFDNAITNVGNAYNANHGTFIAPTAGTYVFAVTLFHHSSMGTPGSWGSVMVSGQRVAILHVNLEQSSQTIVVRLKAGDDVSVQNTHTDRGFFGDYYSTFSGFLLYQDFSSGAIVG
ncbi:caprin-2-like [Mercenaria mercenaria]|uniref:caprin-2-like n=1 Tax=Mercenaria mercenaria TaxID=6596 RepID=UPI00234F369D|nr:caprin-2-like [Mercenaria mercenaria]